MMRRGSSSNPERCIVVSSSCDLFLLCLVWLCRGGGGGGGGEGIQ